MTVVSRLPSPSAYMTAQERKKSVVCNIPFAPVRKSRLDVGLSAQGQQCQSVASSVSTTYRKSITIPFPTWKGSSYYPGPPLSPDFQLLGMTSLSRSAYGVADLLGATKSRGKARLIGDKQGERYSIGDGIIGGLKVAYGPVIGMYRVTSIGAMIKARLHSLLASQWTGWARAWRTAFTGLNAIIYGANGLREGWKAKESYCFQSKLDKRKTVAKKIAYLKQRLHADESVLIAKEKKRLIQADPNLKFWPKKIDKLALANIEAQSRSFALQQQSGFLQDRIVLMRKHKICKKGFELQPDQLQRLVKKRFTDQGLTAYGKELLITNLKERKIAKMSRLVGSAAIKEINQAKTDNPSVWKKFVQASEKTSLKYWKRSALYTAGAILLGLGAVYTSGIIAVILAIALIGIYGTEFSWHCQRMQELRKDDSFPSGNADKLIPKISLALNVSIGITVIALTAIFSLPLVPLFVTIGGLSAWAWVNFLQMGYIDQRKERYIEKILEKPHLSLVEFSYIIENASPSQIEKSMAHAFKKLSKEDQTSLRKSLDREKKEDRCKGLIIPFKESISLQRKRMLHASSERISSLLLKDLEEFALLLDREGFQLK